MNALDQAASRATAAMGSYRRTINPGRLNCLNYYKMAAQANHHEVHPQQYLLNESANIGMNADTLQDHIPHEVRLQGADLSQAVGMYGDIFTTADHGQHDKEIEMMLPRNYKQFRTSDRGMHKKYLQSRNERRRSIQKRYGHGAKYAYRLLHLTRADELKKHVQQLMDESSKINSISEDAQDIKNEVYKLGDHIRGRYVSTP